MLPLDRCHQDELANGNRRSVQKLNGNTSSFTGIRL